MSKKTATAYIIFTFHSDLTVLYRNFAFKKRSWSSFNKLQNTFNNRSKTDGNLTYSTHKFLILNCPQTCRDHSCKVIISLSTFNPTMPLDAGWYPIMSWDITSSHRDDTFAPWVFNLLWLGQAKKLCTCLVVILFVEPLKRRLRLVLTSLSSITFYDH